MRWLVHLLVMFSRLRLFRRKYKLGIHRDDLVLDVGSGNDPHPRADVLCDFSLTGDWERAGPIVRHGRPLVVGDITNLPFIGGAFDYVICSHTLEHVASPERAIRELMRVGRRGYIETPSEFTEKLSSFPFHKWFVRLEHDMLIFRRKSGPCFDPLLSSHFFSMWNQRDQYFLLWSFNSADRGLVQYHWTREIKYLIEDDQPENYWDVPEIEEPAASTRKEGVISPLRRGLKWMIRSFYSTTATPHRRKIGSSLLSLLRCPNCCASLNRQQEILICPLGHSFPLVDGCPVLFAESSSTT